jgi:hypothetical protein
MITEQGFWTLCVYVTVTALALVATWRVVDWYQSPEMSCPRLCDELGSVGYLTTSAECTCVIGRETILRVKVNYR